MELYIDFITARKRSLRRLCFYTCLSVHRGGGAIPECIAGGIPACLAAGLQGGLLLGGLLQGGLLTGGAWWRPNPPGRLLLWAVRILLECILVFIFM